MHFKVLKKSRKYLESIEEVLARIEKYWKTVEKHRKSIEKSSEKLYALLVGKLWTCNSLKTTYWPRHSHLYST